MFERERHESSLISDSLSSTRELLKQLNWPTLLSGLAMGLVIMQMLVGQSVCRRMEQLTIQMAETQKQMALLVGSAEDVAQTNDLLSRLTVQKSQLQSKIAEMSRSLPLQAAGIAEAQDVLTQFAQLKQQTLNEQTNIVAAREQMNAMATIIKGLVIAGDKMLQARTAASELLALKDLLTLNEDGLDRSQASADRLIGIQEQLAGIPAIRADEARNNMLAMVEMQQKLSSQTRVIAENVENLELMADFQTVLTEQLTNMEGIRRQLTDLVLMESTLARAARVLSPLAEIANIRGLRDDDEVREAARRVLDRRLGQNASSTQVAEGVKGDVTTLAAPEDVFDTPARPAPTPPME